MGTTTKVIRKMAGEIQSGGTYESSAMNLMPYVGGSIKVAYDAIEDASISGEAFRDIPQQGPRRVMSEGLGFQVDSVSSEILLEALFGNNSSKVYTLGNNTTKMSFATCDGVNSHNKYADVFFKKGTLKGSVGSNITLDAELVGETNEDRTSDAFPSAAGFGEPFTFHEAGSTNGYVRVGDAHDALASGDNIEIEDFSFDIENGFDHQHCNDGLGILTPIFGQTAPAVNGSFTVARHDTDQWLTWADAHTPLQMAIMIYKSATASLLIEIPRFVIQASITDDDLTKVAITCNIGRNGTGTSYTNSNMAFVSPIRATLVNS